MDKRIRTSFIFSVIFIMLSLGVLGGCGKKEADSTTVPKEIKIGTIRVPNDQQLAKVEGYFDDAYKKQGIKVKFVFFDSGVAANQAFASGSIDFAEMGYTNGVVALNRQIPVKLIWIHDVLGENEALVARKESGVKTISDLKGKKIATPFSSTSHFSLLKALEAAGIEKDVTILDMQTADIVAAWQRGDIDAAYTWEPTLTELKKTGMVITDSKQLAQQGYMTTNIELVRTAFAEKYPQLVVDYLGALAKANNAYQKDPTAAAAKIAGSLNLTAEETLQQMKGSTWLTPQEQLSPDYFGTSKEAGQFQKIFLDTAKFLKEQKSIDQVPSKKEVQSFVDPSYIEQLVKGEK